MYDAFSPDSVRCFTVSLVLYVLLMVFVSMQGIGFVLINEAAVLPNQEGALRPSYWSRDESTKFWQTFAEEEQNYFRVRRPMF